MRFRTMLSLTVAAGVALASADARWTDLAPKPFENVLYVQGFASRESDDNHGGTGRSGWDDTFFKEEVTLFSKGYFYHPRFLQYVFSVSGALKQENYSATGTLRPGWKRGTGVEYEARLLFLPEHPYNVELFSLRQEPMYKEQAATQNNSVETSSGVTFRYRRRPFFFHTGYLDNRTKSWSADAEVKRAVANGQYFKTFAGGKQLSLNALFQDARFTGASGLDGSTRDYGASGFLDVRRARVNATLTKADSSQDNPGLGRSDNDRLSFSEQLTVYLPANFRTELSYHLLDNDSTTPLPTGPGERKLSERSREAQFDLIHKLYQSLDSRYSFLRGTRTSSAGDATLTTHTIAFNYGKMIPRGRVSTGVVVSRNDSHNSGRTDIVSESHPQASVPGFFLLGQQNVQPGSIDVSLPSPVAPYPIVHLVEGPDFTVTPVGNRLQIDILPLAPPFTPGTYDVSVSYSLVSGEFELLTKSYAGSVSVTVLDNLLTPYAEYVAIRSDVTSGSFPGLALDSTTATLGLNFLDGPWRALAEYQSLQWDVSPYRSWRGEVQYVGSLTPGTRAYATATYLHRYYPDGAAPDQRDPYVDQITTATGSIQRDLFSRSLTLAVGGTFSRQQGRVRGDAYSLNASLNWKVGKLDLSAGASAYGSETRALGADPYTRTHQYYYFRIRRRFSR